MLIALTNNFHNTETAVRVTDGRVSHRAGRRAWKNLCGVAGCICGGQLGQRGRQFYEGHEVQIEPDFSANGDCAGVCAATIEIRDNL